MYAPSVRHHHPTNSTTFVPNVAISTGNKSSSGVTPYSIFDKSELEFRNYRIVCHASSLIRSPVLNELVALPEISLLQQGAMERDASKSRS